MKNKIEIIPAILPESFHNLKDEISHVAKLVNYIQIDITDGKFAPSKTWPFNGRSEGAFDELKSQELGLPHWEDVNFEVDLMVHNQIEVAQDWISIGVSRIIFHVEALKEGEKEQLKQMKEDSNVELVLALNPSTPNSVIDEHMEYIDGVQFMGNDRIGYHGVDLDRNVLEKISELRAKEPELPIGIDIGVNMDTVFDLAQAGVTRFSSGSLILESDIPKQTIREMREIIEEALE